MARLFECTSTGFRVPRKDDDELGGNGGRQPPRRIPTVVATRSRKPTSPAQRRLDAHVRWP